MIYSSGGFFKWYCSTFICQVDIAGPQPKPPTESPLLRPSIEPPTESPYCGPPPRLPTEPPSSPTGPYLMLKLALCWLEPIFGRILRNCMAVMTACWSVCLSAHPQFASHWFFDGIEVNQYKKRTARGFLCKFKIKFLVCQTSFCSDIVEVFLTFFFINSAVLTIILCKSF